MCRSLDDSRFLDNAYHHQVIDDGNAHEKTYFHISAPDFTMGLNIGFSNGYNGSKDEKWEIIAGGFFGREFAIRHYGKTGILIRHRNADITQWEEVRDNLAVQVRDGSIALYSTDLNGTKIKLLVAWNDDTIVKSDLNTLTMTGGYDGFGNVHTRGICKFHLYS